MVDAFYYSSPKPIAQPRRYLRADWGRSGETDERAKCRVARRQGAGPCASDPEGCWFEAQPEERLGIAQPASGIAEG